MKTPIMDCPDRRAQFGDGIQGSSVRRVDSADQCTMIWTDAVLPYRRS
jgi:hypothetical protein